MTDIVSEEEYLANVSEFAAIKNPTAAQKADYMEYVSDVARSKPTWAVDSTVNKSGKDSIPVYEKTTNDLTSGGQWDVILRSVGFTACPFIAPFLGITPMSALDNPDNYRKTTIVDGEDTGLTPSDLEASYHQSSEYILYQRMGSYDAEINDLTKYIDLTEGRSGTPLNPTTPLGTPPAGGEPFNIGDYTIYIIIAVAVIALILILKR